MKSIAYTLIIKLYKLKFSLLKLNFKNPNPKFIVYMLYKPQTGIQDKIKFNIMAI